MSIIQEVINNTDQDTVKYYFFNHVLEHPQKRLFEWINKSTMEFDGITYADFANQVINIGSALYHKGYKGKKIALCGVSDDRWIKLFCTVLFVDAIIIPIDPALSQDDLVKRLKFVEADVLFTDRSNLDDLKSQLKNTTIFDISIVDELLAKGQELICSGDHSFADIKVHNEDTTLMIFTSGTGGKIKAAMLSQEGLTLEKNVWEGMGITGYTCFIVLPLFHIAGIGDLRGVLLTGGTAVISQGLKYLLQEYAYAKPYCCFMVPAQANFIYKVLEDKDYESAHKILGGNFNTFRTSGAPLPERLRDLFNKFDIQITSDYGMTETTGPVSVAINKDGRIYSKKGSVGHILDALDVRIDNPDENGCGEVIISGKCLFKGYYNDPEETEKILYDGYIHTGDIGRIDEDGFLYIVGRKKNIIILSSGKNIIPEELEKKVSSIKEVTECLIFEKADAVAVRVYSDRLNILSSEEDIKELESVIWENVRTINKSLQSYERIQDVEISLEPLKKTSTGKIMR